MINTLSYRFENFIRTQLIETHATKFSIVIEQNLFLAPVVLIWFMVSNVESLLAFG